MNSIYEYVKNKKHIVAAHRGASGHFKENTILALKKAFEMGADVIEFDVRLTKDKQIVCFHDEVLNGTPISELNYEDFSNNEITLLIDVFKEFSAENNFFIIEIKKENEKLTDFFIEQIIKLLDDFQIRKKVVIISEIYEYLKLIKNQINNDINTGIIYTKYNEKYLTSKDIYIDSCVFSINELSDVSNILNAHNNNIFKGVYGVNTKQDVIDCIYKNVCVIGTDFPQRIKRFLEELNEKK